MEKSIENIWKQGFFQQQELLAPKLNNLYHQKSALLLEQLKATYQKDNAAILPLAVLFGAGFSYAGHVVLGLYGMVLMLLLFFLNRQRFKGLKKISPMAMSYDYLVAYKNAIRKTMAFYTRLLGIGFPVAIIPAYWLFFRETDLYQKFMVEFSAISITLFVGGIAVVLSVLGVLVYRLSTRIVYGRLLKRLDEIIADLEELQA